MTANKKALRAPAAKPCRYMADKAASKSVNAVFSANRVLAGGVSKSPSSDIYVKGLKGEGSLGFVNVCVDYLKVSFAGAFDKSSSDLAPLWRALFVDPSMFAQSFGCRAYGKSYLFGIESFAFYDGYNTKNKDGKDTWLLEIKGSGCRDFEQRVAFCHPGETDSSVDFAVKRAWSDLVHLIVGMGGVCCRLDLPTDDFSGIVPFDGLKERCLCRSYQSNMRSWSLFPDFPDGDPDAGKFQKSNKRNVQGWSYTLGSTERKQLCIYDKKAEREARTGQDVLVSSWIRYECRFFHDCGDTALKMLCGAFDDGDIGSFIVSVLAGSIRFVGDKHPYHGKNRAQAPVWGPWAKFISGHGLVRVLSQARAEASVQTNARFLDLEASKSLARLAGSDPSLTSDYIRYLLNSGVSKMDGKDLIKVNQRRMNVGLDPYSTVGAMVSSIIGGSKDFVDILQDVPDSVSDLFGKSGIKNGSSCITDFDKHIPVDDGGMYGDLDRLSALYGNDWFPDVKGKGGH